MAPEDFKALGPAAAELMRFFQQGGTLGTMLGVSRQSQEQLYQLAHRLYGQAKYAEAGHIFSLLTTANHLDRRFPLGGGACAHMQRRHKDAVGYYGIAFMLDMTDPEPPIHMAENLLALGDREKARQMLDYGLVQARYHARHKAHVPRLEALLALLDAQPGAGPAPAPSAESPAPVKEQA